MHRLVFWWKGILCVVVAIMVVIPISAIYFSTDVTQDFASLDPNNPPDKPILDGPERGEPHKLYCYTACTTDPDGNRIFYTFDWGDDCQYTVACCFASGECCAECHCWEKTGTYYVRVCAVDCHQCYGEWSDPLPVIMPKNSSPYPNNGWTLLSSV